MISHQRRRGVRSGTARVFTAATVLVAAAMAGALTAPASATTTTASGVEARASQWWLSGMQVTKAHQVTRGKGVKICLIDDGVDTGFPDLAGTRFAGGTDLTGRGRSDGLGQVDLSDHGTAMATFIAGQGHGPGHTQGLLGTAPEAEIISVSTPVVSGTRWTGDAFKYCADHGAQVINYSRSGTVDYAALRYAQARDLVVVAGTGNDGGRKEVGSTAGQWGVLGVGGVDANRIIDPHSNAGGVRLGLPGFDNVAPNDKLDKAGVAVMGPYSLAPSAPDETCEGGYYLPGQAWRLGAQYTYSRQCGGTSSATAIVSGIVALVRSAHPELNAANVVNRIVRTASPPTDGSKAPSPLYGFGIVDAYAAVTADVPTVEHNPLGSAYTHSRGIWDPRVTPQRPEPPAHNVLPATDWHVDTPAANAGGKTVDATASAGAGQQDAKPTSGASLPFSLTAVLIVLGALVLVVGGIVVAVVLAVRRSKAQSPPFPGPRPPFPGP